MSHWLSAFYIFKAHCVLRHSEVNLGKHAKPMKADEQGQHSGTLCHIEREWCWGMIYLEYLDCYLQTFQIEIPALPYLLKGLLVLKLTTHCRKKHGSRDWNTPGIPALCLTPLCMALPWSLSDIDLEWTVHYMLAKFLWWCDFHIVILGCSLVSITYFSIKWTWDRLINYVSFKHTTLS